MLLSLLSAISVIEFDMKLNEQNLDIRIQYEQPGFVKLYYFFSIKIKINFFF